MVHLTHFVALATLPFLPATLSAATPPLDTRQILPLPLPIGSFLATCPTPETTYTSANGNTYRICSGTEYIGLTANVVTGITSVNACAARCSTTSGCTKAVWDTTGNRCLIKAAEPLASIFWVVNSRYRTIRRQVVVDKAIKGEWSDVIRFPVIPVGAYVVPQFPEPSRVLLFSAYGNDTFGGASGKTQFADYNFVTGVTSHREVSNTQHDMFCPGITQLGDGRIVVQGGSNAEATSLYNPATNTFTRGANLVAPRGYQTSTLLSNGKIFTLGGAWSGARAGKNGEVYDPVANTWTALPGADVTPILTTDREGIFREDNHAWLFGWKNGWVFQAGPGINQHWYGTSGTGSVQQAGTRDTDDAMCGIWVMYDAIAGKIFSAGGSPDYTESNAITRAHITTIGDPGDPSSVERVADMGFPRGFSNAVVLPDGNVLVTGGQRRSRVFTNTDATLVSELFNPVSKTWTQLASESVPRTYHSVSILLSDGRVFSGGGGLCGVNPGSSSAGCDRTVDHPDAQIYSPPYLFNTDGTLATRPVISGLSQSPVQAGDTLSFSVSGSLGSLSLIRLGSATHSVNSDQRRIPLDDFVVSGNSVTVELPGDYGILIPGFYYLFAVSTQGTPSVAKSVHVVI